MSTIPAIPVQGTVVFRLVLDESSIEIAASRKRKRPEATQQQQQSVNKNEATKLSGFLFFPAHEFMHVNPQFTCYLLSVPHQFLRRASEAAVYNLTVSITRYAVIALKDQMQTALLEVWSDGFRLMGQAATPSFEMNNYWALSHFRRREIAEKMEMKTSRRKDLYNIIATVDAISPIIPLDPEDPFCLVELYDKNHEENTCVLVLNGHDALVWQSAIQPGETLQLEGLQRKPWQVPDALAAKPTFQQLVGRIPSFVFVFSMYSKIFWPSDSDHTSNSETYASPIPPIPVPLISMEGMILSTERKTFKRGAITVQAIHRLVIECNGESDEKENPSTHLLFLTHFPMSMDFQLSLQSGTRIRAVNVHPIEGTAQHESGLQAYGACLRSTVTLVCTSSEGKERIVGESQNSFGSMDGQLFYTQQGRPCFCSSTDERSLEGLVPYRVGKIKLSYRDMIFRRHAEKWLDDCFADLDVDRVDSMPSAGDILGLSRREGTGMKLPKKGGYTRNPYAEFFDHAFDVSSFYQQQNTIACGCNMTREESDPQDMPSLVGLNDVRMAGLRTLGRRFAKVTSGSPISKGWSGSIHLPAEEIALELNNRHANGIFVGGYVCATTQNKDIASVTDKICQLSLRFSDETSVSTGDFVSAKVLSAVVSCFCILVPDANRVSSSEGCSINVQSLPPLANMLYGNVMGGGALVRLGNYVLIASVQLRCSEGRVFARGVNSECARPLHPHGISECTIEACLTKPREWKCSSSILKGFVLRSRFKHAKVNSNGLSSCLTLTLSDIAVRDDGILSPSFLQTINLKVAIPHNTSKTIAFKRVLTEIISEDMQVLEDECTLGVSWWVVAESCETSPIVSGGWDDWKGDESSWNSRCTVLISLPSDSLDTSHRGYVRWSCRLDALDATFAQTANADKRNLSASTNSAFDFIGRGKFFDGMLCSRPTRKSIHSLEGTRCVGVLLDNPSCDVTPCSLSDIFILACESIRRGDPHVLAPSMVRRITRANFLGVAFCCAECKCSSCFQLLVDSGPREKSFWHLPAPGGPVLPNKDNEHDQSSRCLPHIKNSSLRCPNKCDLEHYTVNWECSGFLDDGTGQVKLYAEREVAITLLGFPKETIDIIEQAMWKSQSGTIRYTKSIPPTNQLQEQVKYALSRVRKGGPCALEFLPPAARAEYLLYQHCRTSKQPSRKLDYFVRCKPLSDNVTHLNHTTIESFVSSAGGRKLKSWSEESSYSLPPIKLELVDCSISTHD